MFSCHVSAPIFKRCFISSHTAKQKLPKTKNVPKHTNALQSETFAPQFTSSCALNQRHIPDVQKTKNSLFATKRDSFIM